jgi:hypothetical protein
MEEETKNLKRQLQSCYKKYENMKLRFLESEKSKLSYKIRKRTDRFWSVVAVFLTSSESGTSLVQKLVMFFKTMWSWAKSGFKLEDEQDAQAKFEICKACPYLTETDQCDICGCFMKKKVFVSGASCPLNKW